ncbi:MAG: hypothetical protein V3W41_07345 [Planctomycetota bacterium]
MITIRRLLAMIALCGALVGCVCLEGTSSDGEFEGLASAVPSGCRLDLVLVHGMGGYHPPDPKALLDGICKAADLKQVGEVEHQDFSDGKRYFGRLKRYCFRNQAGDKELNAWVYFWTGVTTPVKQRYLDYDREGGPGRLEVNGELKRRIVNKNFADVVLYLGPHGKAIRSGLRQTLEMMIEDGGGNTSGALAFQRRFAFVTFSLGSRMLLDTVAAMAESAAPRHRDVAEQIAEGFSGYFMLANQFALLELLQFSYEKGQARDADEISVVLSPQVTAFDKLLRRAEDSVPGKPRVPIVAFSDPNDILSYDIPPWMKEAFPGRFVNVSHHVVKTGYWIPFFGAVASPERAHNFYGSDPKVVDLIVNGTKP